MEKNTAAQVMGLRVAITCKHAGTDTQIHTTHYYKQCGIFLSLTQFLFTFFKGFKGADRLYDKYTNRTFL